MINRETNLVLALHLMPASRTCGRWQALNARLSREAAPLTSGWARHSSASCKRPGIRVGVSTPLYTAADSPA